MMPLFYMHSRRFEAMMPKVDISGYFRDLLTIALVCSRITMPDMPLIIISDLLLFHIFLFYFAISLRRAPRKIADRVSAYTLHILQCLPLCRRYFFY
jgi:hypothetical protein